ncbi:uncharacterized protein K02A2.6-like [Eriocheir sinensis]|uniref:uncharacterized protein K02A2.6-like n=1 Tax=Eriocheir sinensis TaxID=95602 RepID=UPI0021C67C82|nr:uncharacterized protein K02A2.6-like [Eriocheir sinensis]
MVLDVPAPKAFSVQEDPSSVAQRWKKWMSSFEVYLRAAGVTKVDQKAALLLHVAGLEVQDIFATLQPEGEAYDDLKTCLNNYFTPKANIRYERFLFSQCVNEANEKIDTFVTKLKRLALSCEFTDTNDVIIDQVIAKCKSHELRKKLLQEKNLTLDKVLEIARALEAATSQAQVIEGKAHNSSQVQINKLSKNPKQPQKQWQTGNNTKAHGKPEGKQPTAPANKTHANHPSQHNKVKGQHTFHTCYRCGRAGHYPSDRTKCPATDKQCNNCGRKGHFSTMCKSRKPEHINCALTMAESQQSAEDEQEFAFQINSLSSKEKRLMITVNINDTPIAMQVDTAADVSVMPEQVARKIPDLSIEPCNKVLKDYNSHTIQVIGLAKVNVQYDQQTTNLSITIVKGQGQTLMGLDWLKHIKLDWSKVFNVLKVEHKSEIPLSETLSHFKEIFSEGHGTVKNVKASLALKSDATPKFCAPRAIPYALKASVEQEIRRLESEGTWERVMYSDWGTPLVPVAKKGGGVRLCGDYKVTLNPQLQIAQHPLPNPTDMFSTLGKCKIFSKIDKNQAFQQLIMDDKSQEYCTINTHLGLFRPKRLPYGVASSPAIWQQTMDKIFNGLPGVFCFIDDILIAGKDETEHQERLAAVLRRIQDNGIKIHRNKCQFHVPSIEYLGFIINEQGIHKTNDKVKAVQSAKVPENVKELQSFLGLVTVSGKFIRNLATIAEPLYQLLNKDVQWNWTEDCQKSFEKIKTEITSPNFLTHFRMDLPVKLVCDASQVGVGAVLAHEMPDGTEKPIAYASRLLNKAERNYSQIEKEGLALVYGVKKFHIYLYGRKEFKLVTDHKPLLAIVGPKSGLPTLVAARLQRWAITLAAYNYTLEYRPTAKMGNADALSRLPVDKAPTDHDVSILLIDCYNLPITAKHIAQGIKQDPTLSKVLQALVTGRDSLLTSEECKPYVAVWSELSVEQDCILRGSRIVVPKQLREQVLTELHADHQGIVRAKAVARSYMWWPGVDKDIETYIKQCTSCAIHQNDPKPARFHPWEYPRYPWQRLHIDYAGPFLGHSYLIVVDAYSKWPEIIPMQSTTSSNTIRTLMQIFAVHGLPERIVSDNGPQFCSQEFKDFLTVNGIQHIQSAPYHPATNGEAERFVQTFKQHMKCKNVNSTNVHSGISKFLLTYRTTPHATTGVAPSILLMGRRIRTKLDLMLPNFLSEQQSKGWKQLQHQGKVRAFEPSSPVMVRSYTTPDKWVPGTIERQVGNMHYDVKVNGSVTKRHIDQLKPSWTDKTQNNSSVEQNASAIQHGAEQIVPSNNDEQLAQPTVPLRHSPAAHRVLPDRATRGLPSERLDL